MDNKALNTVRTSAFNSGQARDKVIAATSAACGTTPNAATYAACKLELQVGFMAAALARKGDNRRPDTLMKECRLLLTVYQGFGGTAKLREGMKGRRTKEQEDAYGSARALVTGVMKDAGVKVASAEKRGGDTSSTRGAGGKVAAKGKKAANSNKPATPGFKDKGKLIAYGMTQAAALLGTVNKNARIVPPAFSTAVMDFHTAMKKIVADNA